MEKLLSKYLMVFIFPLNIYAANQTICGKYGVVNIRQTIKSYTINNSICNELANSHCLSINDIDDDFSMINSIHSKSTNGAPAAYSFIGKGCHWGNCTNKSGMPIAVGNILNARSSWRTVQPTTGIYNVSYDLWFNRSNYAGGQADGAELMIWLAYKGAIQPISQKIITGAILDGTKWDIWFGLNGRLPVISYVKQLPVSSVNNLNFKAFLDDAIARNKITSSWYLIGVEAGFEVWQGGNGLKSTAYSVLVE